jgi:putative ABC transport system permease protein
MITSRVFRWLVRLLPASTRKRDVEELCDIYDAIEADARRIHGALGSLRTFATELPGFAALVVREHHLAWRQRRHARALARHQLPYIEDRSMIDSWLQDVRYATRSLWKSKSFAAISIATLALGIGANTAIFSVVNGVLLQPLPFASPERIVTVMSTNNQSPPGVYGSSPANFNAIRRDTRAGRVAGFSSRRVTFIGNGEPESIVAVTTVGDVFGVLGVTPLLGRTLEPNDDLAASSAVAVLNYQAWQRIFGGDPAVIGKSVTIGRTPRVIVGVMPAQFHFSPAPADIWIPEQWSPEFSANRDQYYLQIIARLAPAQTKQQFSAELEAVAKQLRQDFGEYNTDLHLSAESLQETVVSAVSKRLWVLMGAVAFLLLITCANLANLALARASSRQGEFAVRRALGAGCGRIVRQLLTESILLAIVGGAVGLGLGKVLLEAIVVAERTSLPRVDEVGLNLTAIAFAIAVSLIAGIAVGIIPSMRVSTSNSMDVLRQGLRGTGTNQRARSVLVVAELALALMLLTGAGLLIRSFSKLIAVDVGFPIERLLTLQMTVPAQSLETVEQSLERLRAVPGVRAASVTSQLPVTGRGTGAWLNIADRPTKPNETPPAEAYRVVSPEYFQTMGIRLVRGRFPNADDRADRFSGLVVNEALAKRYWPNEDAVGKQVRLGAPGNYLNPLSTIVGVVANTPDGGLDTPPIPAVFVPMRVAPWWNAYTYVVRTSGPPSAVVPAVRRELRALFPMTAIRNVQTMDDVLHDSVAPARLSMRLIVAFAIVALVTAALGVFGVLSFVVAQRTRELGIRMALGAAPRDVRRLVIRYGGTLALGGLVIGLVGSLALTRFIAAMLFEVKPTDPLTFGAVSAILLGIGVFASWLPARRATRIDPIVALRSD